MTTTTTNNIDTRGRLRATRSPSPGPSGPSGVDRHEPEGTFDAALDETRRLRERYRDAMTAMGEM
jgi:hypothetical protein